MGFCAPELLGGHLQTALLTAVTPVISLKVKGKILANDLNSFTLYLHFLTFLMIMLHV
jgi:membrane-associated protease RseP (regulator of RpoE activity)